MSVPVQLRFSPLIAAREANAAVLAVASDNPQVRARARAELTGYERFRRDRSAGRLYSEPPRYARPNGRRRR